MRRWQVAAGLIYGQVKKSERRRKLVRVTHVMCGWSGSLRTARGFQAWCPAGKEPGMGERRLLALVRGHRMKRLLKRLLDSEEFLSDHGIRSISKYRARYPYVYQVNDTQYTVRYEPAESESGIFGGNSNWRGPIWFPINYPLIEALQKFHHYYGDDFLVECPTGSGTMRTL